MEPIINSQLPEFKVQAFQNGNFKTVPTRTFWVSGLSFSSTRPILHLFVQQSWSIWLRSMSSLNQWE